MLMDVTIPPDTVVEAVAVNVGAGVRAKRVVGSVLVIVTAGGVV
jgi:hypothetical protein